MRTWKVPGFVNYFFRYVSRLDNIYKGTAMDALVCDVNHFHSVNKQYGRQFGHNVLRIMGSSMKKTARKTGGIACRQKADTFLLYCPHQDDFETILNEFKSEVYADKEIKERISIRIGLYSNAQQESEVEERYAHAKAAAEKVRDDPDSLCGLYEVS